MDGSELKRKFYEEEALLLQRAREAQRRDQESAEERQRRLALRREREAQRREQESPADKAQRLALRREREAQRRGMETVDERTRRLAQRRRKDAARRGQETPEERSQRLALRRAREAQRRGQETSLEKLQRLAIRRQRQRDAQAREAAAVGAGNPAAVPVVPGTPSVVAAAVTSLPIGLAAPSVAVADDRVFDARRDLCAIVPPAGEADDKTFLGLRRDRPEVARDPTTVVLDKATVAAAAAAARFGAKLETGAQMTCHLQDAQHNFFVPSSNLCAPHSGFTNYVVLEDYFPSSLWTISEARTDHNLHITRGMCN